MKRIAPYVTIDGDSHVNMPPDLFQKYMDPEFLKRPGGPRVEIENGIMYFSMGRLAAPSRATKTVTPSFLAEGPRGGVDPDYRVKNFMDPEGIDRGVIMPPGRIWPAYLGDPEMGNAQVEAYNNWLHDFCKVHPTRLFGYGVLNLADPKHAVKEMRRCVQELGFPAVDINCSVIGNTPEEYRILADEFFYPIWQEAQNLNCPIGIHAFGAPRIKGHEYNMWKMPSVMSDVFGFPYVGMDIFNNLVFGGVCETFPKVKFGIFEGCLGWVAMIVDRIHERREKFAEMMRVYVPKLKMGGEDYIQRQIWFGFEPEDPFLPDFIKWTKAPNRLIYSADYPHLEWETGQTLEYLERADVADAVKKQTLSDNSLEFFRWDDTAVGKSRAPLAAE
ncbi:MAG: amidohydrolase family protein [Rhodospirillaceae bacterium]|nr:amidohydrolase family protein [Rhodospirillaceae bacterium]